MVTVADTAFSIAAIRAAEGALPPSERLFEDPYAACFEPLGRHAAEATARYLALPFFATGIRLRTRFIDDEVRAALAGGCRQLVLLGAGFDARGLRMPEIAATRTQVFEVDTPEQLARKRQALASASFTLPPHVRHVPFAFEAQDLEGELPGSLASAGFSLGARTVFVWEGVIGYIDRAAIDASLRCMAAVSGVGSCVVFTAGHGAFDPEGSGEALRRTGWPESRQLGLDVVHRRLLPGEPPEVASYSHVLVGRR